MAQNKLSRNKRTEAAKRRIAEQPARTRINKEWKLAKHLLNNPNDKQAEKAVK